MSILGIDEVGRGPIAGPLVIGAVILPEDQPWFSELRDSKQLTVKKREYLNDLILESSTTGLGWVPAAELDRLGISAALRLATRRAVESVQQAHTPFTQIIIDGKVNFLGNTPLSPYTSTLIKADTKIPAVSAASIIAKVARDHYMTDLASRYPDYGFENHVGYGTRAHLTALFHHGLTPEHRRSFEPCKTLANVTPIKPTRKNTSATGQAAETAVRDYLKSLGHTIIDRNHKTKFYEIDLISTKDNCIYFTEVKYRQNTTHGTGLEAITNQKLHRMKFAAESYLKYNTKYRKLSPLLAVAAVTGLDYSKIDWFPLF